VTPPQQQQRLPATDACTLSQALGRLLPERPNRTDRTDLALLSDALPQLLWVTDAAGRSEWFNQLWCDYTGLSLAQLCAGGIRAVMHPEDLRRCLNEWTRVSNEGGSFEMEYRVRSKTGAYRWFLARASPVKQSGSDTVQCWIGAATDIHDRRAGEERQRTIAQQLQEALVPQPPVELPGLALSSFYRPALDEANVGGDAYDVFPLPSGTEESRTALCVFDLAGKVLAAARQVATVRNMLRFALYSNLTLSGAVTHLNSILVQQELLMGFATLFVGVYDAADRTLTYVNGGQEPALLWHAATGEVTLLAPTGSVLGGFDGAAFLERSIRLTPGDVLAIITDGMTEIGPNRKTLLEIEGLRALFQQCCAAEAAESDPARAATIVHRLIHQVETFAGSAGIRDDIAMLVGVASAFHVYS